jgi:hypothetical protein
MSLPTAGKTLQGNKPREEQVVVSFPGACAEGKRVTCGVVLVTLCRGAKACERISWRSRWCQAGQRRKDLKVGLFPGAPVLGRAANGREGLALTQWAR